MRPAAASSTLGLQESAPHERLARHGADAAVHLGCVQLVGHVATADPDATQAARLVGGELQLRHEGHEGRLVLRVDVAPHGEPRDGTVEDAGVQEAVAQDLRRGRPDRGLAARAGPVERHAQAAHEASLEAVSRARSALLRARTLPGGMSSRRRRADAHPDEALHGRADGREHAPQLPAPALREHDAIPGRGRGMAVVARQPGRLRPGGQAQAHQRGQPLVQLDAVAQRTRLGPVERYRAAPTAYSRSTP